MRFVVHAGPHKTGTSYVQTRMTQNRTWMRSKGWYYPTVGTLGVEGHHAIAAKAGTKMVSDWPLDMELLELADICQRENLNLVLSAEGFRTWDKPRIEYLADVLGFDGVEFVYVVRDPYLAYHAYWAEEVKQGYGNSFDLRMLHSFIDPWSSFLLNPLVDLERISSERVRVVLIHYEALKPLGLDICDLITDSLMGIGTLPEKGFATVNQSFNIELTEFLRLLTFRHFKTKRRSGPRVRDALMRVLARADEAAIIDAVRQHARHCYRSFRLDRDNAFYRDVRRKLAGFQVLRNIPANGIDYFRTDVATLQFIDIDELALVPEVMDLVNEMEARMQKNGLF